MSQGAVTIGRWRRDEPRFIMGISNVSQGDMKRQEGVVLGVWRVSGRFGKKDILHYEKDLKDFFWGSGSHLMEGMFQI